MATKLNTTVPAPRQVWEHFKTERQLLIIKINQGSALCALMDGPKVSKKRVIVPVSKFMFWGDRGMFIAYTRQGRLPSPGKHAGVYNIRHAYLGAQ